MGRPVQYWDDWLDTLICGQLDSITAGEWQLLQDNKEMPTYDSIESFLSKRVAAYEAGLITNKPFDERNNRSKNNVNNKSLFIRSSNNTYNKCPVCSGNHKIYMCEQFKQMSFKEKQNAVTKHSLCFNCLHSGHQVKDCKFPSCPKCGKKHNSKLHQEVHSQQQTEGSSNTNQTTSSSSALVGVNSLHVQSNTLVMLATVVVEMCDASGNMVHCRAVLDSGSQISFVTNHCAARLGLKIVDTELPLTGIGQSSVSSFQYCTAVVHSRVEDVQFSVQLHILPSITSPLPTQAFNTDKFIIPDDIQTRLADPEYNKPGTIDLLLGAELFFNIMKSERHMLSELASFQNTVFGWILTGQVITNYQQKMSYPVVCHSSALSLFCSTSAKIMADEEAVEEHFKSTVSRTETGRFMVRLPLKLSPDVIGNTKIMAKKRFFNLEPKLAKNAVLATQYDNFILEYMKLGHMQPVSYNSNLKFSYYLPHHAVLKDNSSTTKLRVVFDASATGSSGKSLNDIMMKGPTVQPTLYSILLRFRIHRFVLTADIEKMYRQVLVHPDDCELQRILYRSNPSESLNEFTLQTVTYGTKAAPYLATRCLNQLGVEAVKSSTRRTICEDFYVDDLLTGAETIEDCRQLYEDISTTLSTAGMHLRKWCTNSVTLAAQLDTSAQDPNYLLKLTENDTVSTLGVTWNPHVDCFRFIVRDWMPPVHMTKRSLLADINKIYDPLGFISPVLIKGKIFLQKLWLLKLDWDTSLPNELVEQWKSFYGDLKQLEILRIPRRVLCSLDCIELHGFCDASQSAYGACVYFRVVDAQGSCTTRLYTSKSRVAPLGQTTIPRLELSGAALLANLINEVYPELNKLNVHVSKSNIVYWTDSTIVLAWINSIQPLKPYVSNRVAQILDTSSPAQWRHVPTTSNPADIISRGCHAESLSTNELWWHGSQWLQQEPTLWPKSYQAPEELPEVRSVKLVLTTAHQDSVWFLDKYSSWSKLLRVTALVRRFVTNCKSSVTKQGERLTEYIKSHEIIEAKKFWLINVQRRAFLAELTRLKTGECVRRNSPLATLSPFLDEDGLIRVGGRLNNASLMYDSKHPVVIPSSDRVTTLIFRYEHLRLLHAGPQALLAHVSTSYWTLRGRAVSRRIVHQCVQCFRARPQFSAPFMAPLPRVRVSISRAFAHTGVDYCGPVLVRSGLRKVTPIKSYVCVFVCITTRAVHLELVSSLSAEDFVATLSRFMARRGLVKKLYSGNGSNFVGAHRILKTQFKDYAKSKAVNDYLSTNFIEWQFIPPAAPHFGGLWEAAVQSAKRHLLKASKGVLLTFDETTTLLCKVEAVLNSRPLTPMSSDPADLEVLTPGHFLIGTSLMLPPEPDVSKIPLNRLRRFKLMQSALQSFWRRWSLEYLSQIQRRQKWTRITRNAAVGDLAILKDDSLPPLKWSLVRVVNVHPGADGIVRAVTVRNSQGLLFKRPSIKLALLPTEQDETSSEE